MPSLSMEVSPLGRDDLASWAALFDACGCACFCRWWDFAGDKNAWLARDADDNRAESERDPPSGLVARLHAGGDVVGWTRLAPRASLPKLRRQRVYAPLDLGDDAGVLSLACFLVHPAHRRRGVATALLAGAVAHARTLGARAVEAYPRRPREDAALLHDEEAWTGPARMLARAGFVAVAGEDPYPVMRLDLR